MLIYQISEGRFRREMLCYYSISARSVDHFLKSLADYFRAILGRSNVRGSNQCN